MAYAHIRIRPRELDAKNPLGFWDKNGLLNPDQKTWPSAK